MGVFDGVGSQKQHAVEARLQRAIAELRPMLRLQQCGIDLLAFDLATGVAQLRVEGGCPDCTMTAAMLAGGIEAHLRLRVAELREVRLVNELEPNG